MHWRHPTTKRFLDFVHGLLCPKISKLVESNLLFRFSKTCFECFELQVSASNPNDLVQTTKVENVGSSQNGAAAMRTSLVEANNGKDIIQRTEVVNNNNNNASSSSSSDNNSTKLVPRTQVFKGANDNDIVERTRFVKENVSPERSLSADDINDLVQSLSALQQYLPLLSVFPEVHSLPHISFLLKW